MKNYYGKWISTSSNKEIIIHLNLFVSKRFKEVKEQLIFIRLQIIQDLFYMV